MLSSAGSPVRLIGHSPSHPNVKCEKFESSNNILRENSDSDSHMMISKHTRQDPTSHRIIEKRRRDRMNNCLADLSRLIPPEFLKKGRGRIEKTEIIEMASRYIEHLHQKCRKTSMEAQKIELMSYFNIGYRECISECSRFLSSSHAYYSQLINHLQHQSENISKGYFSSRRCCNTEESCDRSLDFNSYGQIEQSTPKELDYQLNTAKMKYGKYSEMLAIHDNSYINMEHSQISSENWENSEKQMANDPKCQNQNLSPITTSQDVDKNYVFSPIPSAHTHMKSCPESFLREFRKTKSLLPNDNCLSMTEDNRNLYKFKNTIKHRFSQSQVRDYSSSSPSEGNINESISPRDSSPGREYLPENNRFTQKRTNENHARYNNYQPKNNNVSNGFPLKFKCSCLKNQAEHHNFRDGTQDNRTDRELLKSKDNSIDMASENDSSNHPPPIGVPIFALHSKGSFYIPLNIDYDSLVPFLGTYDLLNTISSQPNINLHPITINVNYQYV